MKAIYLFLIFIFLFSALHAVAVQPDGEGTEASPYLVTSLDNLQWISENNSSWGSWFLQTADINASDTQNWNSGEGWDPIGNYNSTSGYVYFTGHYDGQGHIIHSLYICRPYTVLQGLFGVTNQAFLTNLSLESLELHGDNYTGGLVGDNQDSDISNCYATGIVTGTTYTGGLVGHNYSSAIINCYATGIVTGTNNTGGLVGQSVSSTISNCYTISSVNGHVYTGGLVGVNSGMISYCYASCSVTGNSDATGGLVGLGEGGTIKNCYATGNVTCPYASVAAGGLLGRNYCTISNCYATNSVSGFQWTGGLAGTNNGMISYCYVTGNVNGFCDIGGLVGGGDNETVVNCFWNTQTTGQTTSAGGTSCSTAQMQDINTYLSAGFDFAGETANGSNDIWAIDAALNDGYPYLAQNNTPATDETVIPPSSAGIVSCFPNPFNPSTTISYSLPQAGRVQLSVYNLKGQLVRTLTDGTQSAGRHTINWSGTDNYGRVVPSGVYFCRISASGRQEARKLLLMK